jgi:hypothetical protein
MHYLTFNFDDDDDDESCTLPYISHYRYTSRRSLILTLALITENPLKPLLKVMGDFVTQASVNRQFLATSQKMKKSPSCYQPDDMLQGVDVHCYRYGSHFSVS